MEGQIRWSRGDYISLGKAVSDFNKKIRELEQEERKLYLPIQVNYDELKNTIQTRSALKQKIKSLRRFLESGSEELYVTEGGEKMTKWEHNELVNMKRVATRKLNRELGQVDKAKTPYVTSEERIIRANLMNIQKLETTQNKEFQRIKSRINFIGSSDYEMKKAVIWKENYLKIIEDYQDYEGYDKLKKLLNKYKNPITFFNLFKESTNTLIDDYIKFLSDQKIGQNQFNKLLNELGIQTDDVQSDEMKVG